MFGYSTYITHSIACSGLVMWYAHVNAQFQVISINIPKGNYAADVISRIIYISTKLQYLKNEARYGRVAKANL